MSDIEALTQEIHELRAEQRQTRDAVIDLRAGLRQRCPNNERRIGEVERRLRNGGVSTKVILTVSSAITAVATAAATAIARIWGGN